jgi:hypothetical protein
VIRRMLKKVPGARALARKLGLAAANKRMFLLKMLPKRSHGAEVGVHMGDFSAQMLSVVKPAKLHLIDPWKHETDEIYADALYGGKAGDGQSEMDQRYKSVCERFARAISSGRVVVHREYSTEALAALPDDSLDWIYIDGNHQEEFVSADLELSLVKVRPEGLITGDDYHSQGWWQGGVKRAVDELAATSAVEMLAVRNQQFVLRRL